MSPHPPVQSRNRLLMIASEADFGLLQSHLEPVELNRGDPLFRPNEPIEHVYFPETGIGSVVGTAEGRQIETGLFGREGMSGCPVLLGSDRSPHESFVQIAGSAQRMRSDALRQAVAASSSLRDLLLRYLQSFMVQISQTAIANGSYTIEERLARWLLMCHDRIDGDDIALTHDFLSTMLGVQRPGVTIALQLLEGTRAIRNTRGRIQVLDRARLEEAAGDSYGVPEAEYRRLIGEM